MDLAGIDIPKPATDITVEGFCNEWMPMAAERLKDVVKENAGDASGTLITAKVTGDGGGEWSLGIADGELEVMEGARDDAAITLEASATNFLDVVSGRRDDVILAPLEKKGGGGGSADPGEIVGMVARIAERARKVEGSVGLNVEDPKEPFNLLVKFAGPDTPEATVTVSVKLADLRKLASGEMSPQRAMLTRKIKIKGAMGFLLKLATLAQKPKK